jgi:hypothetical protein
VQPVKVVVGLACVVMLGSCGNDPGTAGPGGGPGTLPTATTPPPDGSTVVRYELSGTAVNFDGTYSEPAEGAERIVELREAPLPWSRNFTLGPNQLFVAGLNAQAPNLESTVTCKIFKNDAMIAHETGPLVDCRAEVASAG